MLQPKKINKVSPKPEEKTMKDSPRIVSKLTRYEKFVPNEKAPEKMKTRPASPVPSKDLPSKLDAAVKKAKEYKSFDNMPRMKMKQTKTYKG